MTQADKPIFLKVLEHVCATFADNPLNYVPACYAQSLFDQSQECVDMFWQADIFDMLSDFDTLTKNDFLIQLIDTAPRDLKITFVKNLTDIVCDDRLCDVDWDAVLPILFNDNGILLMESSVDLSQTIASLPTKRDFTQSILELCLPTGKEAISISRVYVRTKNKPAFGQDFRLN